MVDGLVLSEHEEDDPHYICSTAQQEESNRYRGQGCGYYRPNQNKSEPHAHEDHQLDEGGGGGVEVRTSGEYAAQERCYPLPSKQYTGLCMIQCTAL